MRADYALRLTNVGHFAHRSGQLTAVSTLAVGGLLLTFAGAASPDLSGRASLENGSQVDASALAVLRAVQCGGHTAGLV